MIVSTVMLRANDDCWCGSGKKYKRCHKRRRCCTPGAVGPSARYPPEIARPDYVETGNAGAHRRSRW